MTFAHIVQILWMAGFPLMVFIHLYSRRHFFCGKIYVDDDEGMIHCYPKNGPPKQFDDQNKAVEYMVMESKPDIQRARIYITDKKPA